MKTDYIPRNEEDFNDFQDNWITKMVAKALAWGIPAGTVTENTDAQTDWVAKYAVGKDEADPNSAQRRAKNDSRTEYTGIIRKTVKQYITNNPVVTDADKVSLRLTVPDTIRTRSAVPDHSPRGAVSKIDHLLHDLRITDPETPNTKAKPKGVARINVYRYIGASPPSGLSDYAFIGSATTSKYVSKFGDGDIGKKAFYILQYENTRGERGPVSDSVSATIA
jgi:hypothetical protein